MTDDTLGCMYIDKGVVTIQQLYPSTYKIRVHSVLGAHSTVYGLLFPLCKHMENIHQEPLAEKRTFLTRILYHGGLFQFGGVLDQ